MKDKIKEIYFNPDLTDNEKVSQLCELNKITINPMPETFMGVPIRDLMLVVHLYKEKGLEISTVADAMRYGYDEAMRIQREAQEDIVKNMLENIKNPDYIDFPITINKVKGGIRYAEIPTKEM